MFSRRFVGNGRKEKGGPSEHELKGLSTNPNNSSSTDTSASDVPKKRNFLSFGKNKVKKRPGISSPVSPVSADSWTDVHSSNSGNVVSKAYRPNIYALFSTWVGLVCKVVTNSIPVRAYMHRHSKLRKFRGSMVHVCGLGEAQSYVVLLSCRQVNREGLAKHIYVVPKCSASSPSISHLFNFVHRMLL